VWEKLELKLPPPLRSVAAKFVESKCATVQLQLEGCIDDERQFKTAKRLVTPLF